MSRFSYKNSGLLSSIGLKRIEIRLLYWICFFFLLSVTLVCILPPLWIFISTMKDINELFAVPPTIIPRSFHPEKLLETWKRLNFWIYYKNTLIIAVGTVASTVIFNGLTGYVLSKLKPKGSSFIFMLMLWTLMLPNTMNMVPLFKNIVRFPILHINLTNSYIPLWMMAGANAFFVIIFKGFFDGIPEYLIESARIDGATNLQMLYKIIVPMSKPVIIVVVILTLNGAWSDFFWPFLILRDIKLYNIMVKIYSMRDANTGGYSMDLQMIALTFAIIPPVILFIFFQKYIMQGFSLGGVKE